VTAKSGLLREVVKLQGQSDEFPAKFEWLKYNSLSASVCG